MFGATSDNIVWNFRDLIIPDERAADLIFWSPVDIMPIFILRLVNYAAPIVVVGIGIMALMCTIDLIIIPLKYFRADKDGKA